MITGDEFFQAPRDWSLLKYKILSCYFSQYFPKVNQAYHSGAVVADLFAGRGRFEDGKEGSPLIIAEQARKYNDRLGYKNVVVLAEKNPNDRDALTQNMKTFIEEKIAIVLAGDASDAGATVINTIKPGVPLFLFLDPFGIKGLSLDLLGRAFQRAKKESTELLINFNHRGLLRLAGVCKNLDSSDATIRQSAISVKEMVTEVLGGDWWLDIINREDLEQEYKATLILHNYIEPFRSFFKWIVYLPVRETAIGGATKYFLIFASRSQVAFELMNDCVQKGRHEMLLEELHEEYQGTFFESDSMEALIPKHLVNNRKELESSILSEAVSLTEELSAYTGDRNSVWIFRPLLRARLIQRHFATSTTSQYNKSIGHLLETGSLVAENGRTRISDQVAFRVLFENI